MQMNIMGVYKRVMTTETGSAADPSTETTESYWLVRRKESDTYDMQELNEHGIPSGPRQTVPKGELLHGYLPQLDYYEKNTLPAMKSLREKLDKGWEKLDQGNLDEAESQFLKALLLDEDNTEASIGLGSVYCERKDYPKVRKLLDALTLNDSTFLRDQRRRFNEFGISLRREKLYNEALGFFSKALEVNAMDENLHFNIARVYYDMGASDLCFSSLDTALELNPNFLEAQRFKAFLTEAIRPRDLGSDLDDDPDRDL